MKYALDVLARYMTKEFSTRGIRVNAVSPGSTRIRIADAFTRFPESSGEIAHGVGVAETAEADGAGARFPLKSPRHADTAE